MTYKGQDRARKAENYLKRHARRGSNILRLSAGTGYVSGWCKMGDVGVDTV
jgi:hypothetical protein